MQTFRIGENEILIFWTMPKEECVRFFAIASNTCPASRNIQLFWNVLGKYPIVQICNRSPVQKKQVCLKQLCKNAIAQLRKCASTQLCWYICNSAIVQSGMNILWSRLMIGPLGSCTLSGVNWTRCKFLTVEIRNVLCMCKAQCAQCIIYIVYCILYIVHWNAHFCDWEYTPQSPHMHNTFLLSNEEYALPNLHYAIFNVMNLQCVTLETM